MPRSAFNSKLLIALAAACLCVSASAQGHPPGGGGGGMGQGHPGNGGGGMGLPEPRNNMPPMIGASESRNSNRGGMELGPPGRWWDDKSFARTLGLNPGQQRRMDDVFSANRDTLLKLYKNLQHEESQLEKMTRSAKPDELAILQQIDRVTQARGELEKANAHMLLQIRKELTPEQASHLDEQNAASNDE